MIDFYIDQGQGRGLGSSDITLGKFKKQKQKNIWMDLVQLTWNPPPPNVDYVFFLTIVLSFFSNFYT